MLLYLLLGTLCILYSILLDYSLLLLLSILICAFPIGHTAQETVLFSFTITIVNIESKVYLVLF